MLQEILDSYFILLFLYSISLLVIGIPVWIYEEIKRKRDIAEFKRNYKPSPYKQLHNDL